MALFIAATLGSTLVVEDSEASWPQSRADARRTGAVTGTGNLAAPVPFWRYFLGGQTLAYQMFVIDQRPDATPQLAVVRGNRLRLYAVGNTEPVWTFSEVPVRGVLGLEDFDGDGSQELLVSSRDRPAILDPTTGSALWIEPEGELGTLSSLRFTDFDGDGKKDMLLQECGCCSVNSGRAGFVYSFGGGYASPNLLWELPPLDCAAVGATSVLDVDGDGGLEVIVSRDSQPDILRASDGTELATGTTVPGFQWANCYAMNVNEDPEEELVCTISTTYVEDEGHQVIALDYSAELNQMVVIWQTNVGELDAKLVLPASPFVDLNADGVFEAMVGGELADGTPITQYLDLSDGSVLATLNGHTPVAGSVVLGAQEGVGFTQSGNDLNLVRYSAAQNALDVVWTLPDRQLLTKNDAQAGMTRRSTIPAAAGIIDLSGDGENEFLVSDVSKTTIEAYQHTSAGAVQVATLHADAEVQLSALTISDSQNASDPLVLSAYSDGTLALKDSDLLALGAPIQSGGYLITGDRLEGRWLSVAAPSGGSADTVFVSDSRGTLRSLDASGATLSRAPEVLWSRANSAAPAVSSDGTAYCLQTTPMPDSVEMSTALVALSEAGNERWSVDLDKASTNDLLIVNLTNSGQGAPSETPVATWLNDDGQRVIAAYNSENGTLLRSVTTESGVNSQFHGLSAADLDADGEEEIALVADHTLIYDGASFSLSQSLDVSSDYGLLSFMNLDDDSGLESVLHSGNGYARSIDDDHSTVLWMDSEAGSYSVGSLVTCSNEPLLVSAYQSAPGRLDLSPIAGPLGSLKSSVYLAAGTVYPTQEAATGSGSTLSPLTSAAAHSNLTGQGHPTVVLGAADGWLYGVDVCSQVLDFAIEFDDSVGAVLFADTDGDSVDEILVSVADGYLYGLKQSSLDAPASVIDEDQSFSGTDIDFLASGQILRASWSSVSGATEYEVSVSEVDGAPVTGSWTSVGNATQTEFPDLTLNAGSQYVVAVRAKDGEHTSADTLSDGVLVLFPGQSPDSLKIEQPADAGASGHPDSDEDAAQPSDTDGEREPGAKDAGASERLDADVDESAGDDSEDAGELQPSHDGIADAGADAGELQPSHDGIADAAPGDGGSSRSGRDAAADAGDSLNASSGSSGCGCRLTPERQAPLNVLWLLAAVLAVTVARAHRRTDSRSGRST